MITELNQDHLSEVADVFVSVYRAEPFSYNWLTKEKACAYLREMLQRKGAYAYAYFAGGKLVGACFGRISQEFRGKMFELSEIFIDQSYARLGNGSRFLLELESKMAQLGVDYIKLVTLRNIPAFNFYRKNGYDCSENTVIMIKHLNLNY